MTNISLKAIACGLLFLSSLAAVAGAVLLERREWITVTPNGNFICTLEVWGNWQNGSITGVTTSVRCGQP